MKPHPPGQSQILTWASELRKITGSDAFRFAVQSLRQDYQNRFFTSGPDDRPARENAYMQNTALDDLIAAMETIIFAAQHHHDEE